MSVTDWLKKYGLEQYVDAFAENGVDTSLLTELTNEDLKDLGVERLADRKRLLKAIDELGSVSDQITNGQQLPVVEVHSAERRQVTILFADITNYTSLATELGAEKTHALLNRYFETVDSVIENYGGTVDKHIGDSVMAVFGAPVAHDDDPLRAIRTALDIHARLISLSEQTGQPLKAHVGIACGEVVASDTGSGAHHEYTVTGESVNLASRLQDRAKTGETLISDAVRRAVGENIDCVSLGEVSVKGILSPVRIWRLNSLLKLEKTIGITEFVGRYAELAQFKGLVDACHKNGNGQAIVVRGEAGIGKSRLVEEFAGIAAEKGFVTHKGLVLDFGVSKGDDAVRSVVQSLIGLQGDDRDSYRSAADMIICRGLLLPAQRIFLNDLLGLPQTREDHAAYEAMDNTTRNEGKHAVVSKLLSKLSAEKPFIVIIEDVHWAEPSLLRYLARMAVVVAECRAILIMTSRVEGDPLNQIWRSTLGGCPLITIDLGPLRKEESLKLASAFINSTNNMAQECIPRSGGNPLFLEQLLLNVEERGDRDIPASIQSLVLARIDRLLPADKSALQAASILGQRFSLDALRHLIANSEYSCSGLLERHLVRPEGDDYLFTHALVQEGVYSSLLTDRRTRLHRIAAEWYGKRDTVLRAEHLERAGDPTAAEAYIYAAQEQLAAFRFDAVLKLTARGLELAENPASKFSLSCIRGEALRNMRSTEDSIAAFEGALEWAVDDAHRCRAWIGMGEGLRIADRQEDALKVLEKAEVVAVDQKLISEQARIHYLRGNVYFPLGNIEGCLAEHEKALIFARQNGSTETEALALGGLGDAYYLNGRMQTACEQFRSCIELCRKNDHRYIEVSNRHMIGWSRIFMMEFAEALEDAKECAEMAAYVSHHRGELLSLMLAGTIECEFGKYAIAQEYLDRGLDVARTMGARNFEAQLLSFMSRVSAGQGQRGQANDLARQAVAVVRDVGKPFIGPTVLAMMAATTDDPGEREKALVEAENILDSGCVAHNQFWFSAIAIDLAISSCDWEKADRYAARLEAYTQNQKLAWADFLIARGRALASWGRGNRESGLSKELERLKNVANTRGIQPAIPAIEQALSCT